MGEQFLEGEPALRRMVAGEQLRVILVPRRPVQQLQRIAQRRQVQGALHLGGQPVAHAQGAAGFAQRLADQHAQPQLGQALGGRIHRRQGLLQRLGILVHAAVFRMHDLQAQRSAPHLAIAAQAQSPRQGVVLRGR